jgi:hypothetical protein
MFPVSSLRQSRTTIVHKSVTTLLLLPAARKLRENERKKERKKEKKRERFYTVAGREAKTSVV